MALRLLDGLRGGGALGLGGGFGATGYAGSQVGFPLYLGPRGQHQLKIGLGAGWGAITLAESLNGGSAVVGFGFALSPSLRYTYHTAQTIFLGVSLRTLFPLSGQGSKRGGVMFAAFNIGFSRDAPR